LEDWLKEFCRAQKKVEELESEWQYLTGHEPRKTRQYLKAIESQGKIKLFNNKGEQVCLWVEGQDEKAAKPKPKPKLFQEFQNYIEKEEIREKMLAGPCKHRECPPFANDCRTCSAFRNLKNKDFLALEE
jgi:hypothetical protein